MFCSISGEIPLEPVVANGFLFEKRLITKFIQDSGKCPISNVELSEEDLIAVHANKGLRPRPVSSASIPGLLATFQNEWDEVMLETFSLRQSLDVTRQELSQALYQHDAACRVIARLTRERDEARTLLVSLQANYSGNNDYKMVVDDIPAVSEASKPSEATDMDKIPPEIISEINEKCKFLSSKRKGRKPSDKLASKESVSVYTQSLTLTPHKADSKSGVTSIAVNSCFSVDKLGVILSGSIDKSAVLSEQISGKVIAKLVGHSKKVNAVAFAGSALVSASSDKSVKIWNASSTGKYVEFWDYSGHDSDVTAVAVHPTGNYLTSVSLDGSWRFLDISVGRCLKVVKEESSNIATGVLEYTSCAFHPDGLIMGTGTAAGLLKVWDIREQVNVANCAEHTGAVNSISFSENGYLVATGSSDGDVKIWDLRKLQCTRTLDVGPGIVSGVAFDYSGSYLAIGGGGEKGHNVQVQVVKDWGQLLMLDTAHSKQVTSVAWADDAVSLVSASLDRSIKVFSASAI